jgi:hypothetical protein
MSAGSIWLGANRNILQSEQVFSRFNVDTISAVGLHKRILCHVIDALMFDGYNTGWSQIIVTAFLQELHS